MEPEPLSSTVPAEAPAPGPAPSRRPLWRRIAGAVLAAAVVAVVFLVLLPRIADYGAVWDVVQTLTPAELGALAVATVVNLATFAPPWMAALPGLGYWNATVLTQASTALSIAVPGGDAAGIAASYAMLRGWGFRRQAVAVAVIVTGVGNQLVNVLLPLIALALLVISGGSSPVLLTAGLVGIAVIVVLTAAVVLVLRGERQAYGVGQRAQLVVNRGLALIRRPGRDGWAEALVRVRRETIEIVSDRWPALTASLVVGHLTVFGVLLVSLRATGVGSDEVTWVEALASWGLVRLLTAVPITPAGVGIVELGLSGALVGFGAGNAEAVAAVLLYRALTVIPTLVLGALLGLTWRKRQVAPAGD
jgi:putative heme transporter